MSRVVPAILTEDPKALEAMVRQSESFTDYVQVDIMDGKFVPSQSIKTEDLARVRIKLNWEAHVMVMQPECYFEGLKQAGVARVVFHYEASKSPEDVIAAARGLGLRVGLAINPETSIPTFLPVIDKVDSVLFLSVHPGFYGAKFLPEVLDKVAGFHRLRPHVETGIDGGIKESNISEVAASGADYICVGSAIFLQPDPGAAYRRLQSLAATPRR